jgi:hypothetical protein
MPVQIELMIGLVTTEWLLVFAAIWYFRKDFKAMWRARQQRK